MEEEDQHINKKRKLEKIINNNNNDNNLKFTRRYIKMYCPKSSKIAEIMAWEDQKLDLGSIARIFGVEPVTLRLNGHLISRGVDLIASSVTWRSLVSFFSSKGLSIGDDCSGAIVVDGKLCKCGSKRGHDPALEVENRIGCAKQLEQRLRIDQTPHTEVISSPSNKKLKESNKVCENKSNAAEYLLDTGLKRKNCLENFSPLIKKARVDGRYSHEFPRGPDGSKSPSTRLRCCYDRVDDTLKRMREDEVLASCKRMR